MTPPLHISFLTFYVKKFYVSNILCILGENKSPPLDLMQSSQQQILLSRQQQSSAFSTSIANNQYDQEQSLHTNPHTTAPLGSTNFATSNIEFTGLGNRYGT